MGSVCVLFRNMRKEWENMQCTIFSELPNSNHCLLLNSKDFVKDLKKGKLLFENQLLFHMQRESVVAVQDSFNSSLHSVSISAKIQELLHSLPCLR